MTHPTRTTTLSPDDAIRKLREVVHSKAANFYAMYSSVLGAIVTDPAFMVLPLDDHMVHRGDADPRHAVPARSTLGSAAALGRVSVYPAPFSARAVASNYFGHSRREPAARGFGALLALRGTRRFCPRSGRMRRQQLLRDHFQAGILPPKLLHRGRQSYYE